MKRNLLFVLLLTLSAILLFSCGEETAAPKEHSYGEWKITKAPSCTDAGERSKTCSECGEVITEALLPTGHAEKILPAVLPTCTDKGLTEGKSCTVCGEILLSQTELAALGHTEEIIPEKAPTCAEKGLSEGKRCTVCGQVTKEQTELSVIPHSFGEWYTAKEPTCTEDGEKRRECSCGAHEASAIPAEHKYALTDCSVPRICGVCGESESAPLGHDFPEWTVIEPTCEENGSRSRTCERCGKAESDVIPPKGHSFGDWTVTLEPACEALGERERRCACGKKEAQEIAALGHADGDDADTLCDACLLELAPKKDLLSLIFGNSDYTVIYKTEDTFLKNAVTDFIEDVYEETGVMLEKKGGFYQSSLYEIVIGEVHQRDDSVSSYALIDEYRVDGVSVYSIKICKRKKLVVAASDDAAMELALLRLREFIADGDFAVPKQMNEFLIFDTAEYINNGTVKEIDKDELDALCTLSSLRADGESLTGFSPDILEYTVYTNIMKGYPVLDAKALMPGATVDIVNPTAENGGIGTVTVTARNGDTLTYRVSFIMQSTFKTQTEIVNKDGRDGVITIVVDDGNVKTGRKVEELLEKYPELAVTFAMITRKIAGFALSEDGSEYLRNPDGSFVITQTDEQKTAAEFWQALLRKFPQLEITSHSHTHAYAGENDDELYIAYDSNGNKYVFPKGSISAEVYGSVQIIKELFGLDSPGFIIPGISGAAHGFTVNSWWPYIKEGYYLGARGTSGNLDASSMVMMPSDFKNQTLRWRGRAFMTRYFNIATKTQDDGTKQFLDQSVTAEEAIAAGANHAIEFIDSAMEMGGWACFCLHDIIDAGESGTHPIYMEQADELFAYANKLSSEGNAWVATYGDAMKYYTEWASAHPTAVAHGNDYIELTLTCEEKSEHFDMPLTVKVTVPDTWERVTYTYLGKTVELDVEVSESGESFVLANVAPDTDAGIITPVN
ncbi:MAG: hypothetical protein IKB38_01045 [Clostridia bacterium]|nr:hypothetical protein [Clostridia bacterium]